MLDTSTNASTSTTAPNSNNTRKRHTYLKGLELSFELCDFGRQGPQPLDGQRLDFSARLQRKGCDAKDISTSRGLGLHTKHMYIQKK